MDRNAVRRRLKRLLAVPLLLVLASTQASAIIGVLVGAVALYLVSLLMRTAFISKYALMVLILLNPCVRGPCPAVSVAGLTVPAMPADRVVEALNAEMLTVFIDFYILAILYYAVYVIFMSTSPSARARAKQMLMNLLVGMVVVSQSRVILQLVLNVSQAVAYAIIDIASSRLASLGSLGLMGRIEMCILDLVFVSLGMVAMMAAGMRYFMILLMAAFFPLALFLYFLPWTKNYGLILIRFTVLLIFIQVIQALLYSVTIIAAVDETGLPGFLIAIGGLFGVAYSPMLGMKLMGWLGAVTHFYSTRAGGAATRFVAMLMRGQPVGSAFQTAGAQYMISHNMGNLMRGMAGAAMDASIPVPGTWGARPPAGYGIRSARSFGGISEGHGGITEGHSGVGTSLPATRRGWEPQGDYIYQRTPQAIGGPVGGSAFRQKSQLEREGEYERAAATAAYGAIGRAAGGEAATAGVPPAAGITRAGAARAVPGQGRAGGVGIAAAPEARTAVPKHGGTTSPLGAGAPPPTAATQEQPSMGGAQAGTPIPSAAAEAAAGGPYRRTAETQEMMREEEGRFRAEKPREVMQKQAGLSATKPAGIDGRHEKEMAQLLAKRGSLLMKLQTAGGETPTSPTEGMPESSRRETLHRDLDRREVEEKASLPKRTPGEVKEGIFEEKMPETAREPVLAEPRPSDVRVLYEELDKKLRGLKEVGQEVGEPEEMLREAFSLIGDMKYDEAYHKLENVRRTLGV